jgi:LemA protein
MVALIVIIVLIIILAVAAISLYNGIVEKRNRIDNAWATIAAQLQRRLDLIPNLVNSVKGYMAHEQGVLTAVTEARAAATAATTPAASMEANRELTGALRQLFAVAESYPQLQAASTFLDLQKELAETENRIAYARQSYNDCVLTYNNAIQTFPGNLIAGVGNFTPAQGFTVEDDRANVAPTVEF